MTKPKLGAVLIAALYALGGIMLLLSAIMIKSIDLTTYPELSMLSTAGGLMIGVMAIISFVIAYGVYNMTEWGWIIALILGVIGLIGALSSLNIAGLIIPGLIVWYLWTNKSSFGV